MSADCICGHPISNHRFVMAPPRSGHAEPIVRGRYAECQTRWYEGRAEVYCECPRYSKGER